MDTNSLFSAAGDATKLEIEVHDAENCPLCKEGKIELVKPGSREFKEIGM